MATVRLSDVIVPSAFSPYIVENTFQTSALVHSGVAARNAVIDAQLAAGSDAFTVPMWYDLSDEESNYANDDPEDHAIPRKLTAGAQRVRKSYLHASWSAMNLASELAGADALAAIQSRVTAYWDRQLQRRLIASLVGVMADNIANDGGDMVHDVSGEAGDAANFSASAVIDATATLGDAMGAVSGIAMHSDLYRDALKADLIAFVQPSAGGRIALYRGLAVVVDDGLAVDTSGDDPVYTSILFGAGAVGYGMAEPTIADGTEIESVPSAGQGGGMHVLHSRQNVAVHPAGFAWVEGELTEASPTLADLRSAAHWDRVAAERKAVPLAFLLSK